MTRSLVVLLAAAAFPATALGAPQTVSITDTGYEPIEVIVDRGDIVTWENDGSERHTVTSDRGKTMDSGELRPGSVFATLFDEPGTYAYHDELNPELKGRVVVRNTPPPPTSTEPPPPAGTRPPGFEPGPSTTEATPATAADDEGDGRGAGDVLVDLLAILAVGAAAAGIFVLIARRRGSD